MKSKNSKLLKEFTAYCNEHPEERFWQALRNWAEFDFLLEGIWNHEGGYIESKDTYFRKGKKYEKSKKCT